MNRRIVLLTPLAVLASSAAMAAAQDLPSAQPAMLTIIRERVKLGRNADHARIEAGWPAAFAKAKSPTYYLALVAETGSNNETWFLIPQASNAAISEDNKRNNADPVLSAELARLWRADGDVLDGLTTVQTVARVDLSRGAFPDLSKDRFWEIGVWRMKPGHDRSFEAAAKAYGAAADRANSGTSYRVYQVTAGMPEPTFLVFVSVDDYADFDRVMADGNTTLAGATAEEQAVFQKLFTEGVMSSEVNRYRLDGGMSYVSAQVRATDPSFWIPKRQPRTAAAAPAAP